ncbi:hypothetical protein D9757_006221 [Collybiopsis confluens]|uniref:C2H2-type domain-containing protein n=1 Tax=Collybiopsis confluens TaxID=2823264 RepID=A0A8H5M8J2_9AGAR|nr:hypothetical protein D9757_006221 [Collybiopsis confluens]
MSECAPFTAGPTQFDLYNEQQYNHPAFDFSYHASAEPLAPLPDEFESDLDALTGLDDINLEFLTVENNSFQLLRSQTPTGPPSVITASSESAYDSLSVHSESIYSYSPHSTSNYSFPLEMDFQRIAVDPYASAQAHAQALAGLDSVDPTAAFNTTLPPTPPRSPVNRAHVSAKPYVPRSSFSDYGPPSRNSLANEYYNQLTNYGIAVSPAHITSTLPPVVPSIPLVPSSEEYKGDPRKKYKCKVCPRAFARAYNLKTHMATHDPNRLKPHVCPHRACGRSFSRKHDLGRHLISIHRDESVCSSTHSATSTKSIGVDKGTRSWCDICGKGSIGGRAACNCSEKVK